MRSRIYIASAYTLGDKVANVRASMGCWDRLWKAGYCPLSPLWSHFQHEAFPLPYREWIAYDLEWLPLCHAILRLPGESHGADAEVLESQRLGIPVFTDEALLLQSVPPTQPAAPVMPKADEEKP